MLGGITACFLVWAQLFFQEKQCSVSLTCLSRILCCWYLLQSVFFGPFYCADFVLGLDRPSAAAVVLFVRKEDNPCCFLPRRFEHLKVPDGPSAAFSHLHLFSWDIHYGAVPRNWPGAN